jgi:hypothetical protein
LPLTALRFSARHSADRRATLSSLRSLTTTHAAAAGGDGGAGEDSGKDDAER